MSVLQTASRIGKWWTQEPPKPFKSPQSLTCQCDVSSSKKRFTTSFFPPYLSFLNHYTESWYYLWSINTPYMLTPSNSNLQILSTPDLDTEFPQTSTKSPSLFHGFQCNALQKPLWMGMQERWARWDDPFSRVIHFDHLFTYVHVNTSNTSPIPGLSVGGGFVLFPYLYRISTATSCSTAKVDSKTNNRL